MLLLIVESMCDVLFFFASPKKNQKKSPTINHRVIVGGYLLSFSATVVPS
jgi:hypothetical protein